MESVIGTLRLNAPEFTSVQHDPLHRGPVRWLAKQQGALIALWYGTHIHMYHPVLCIGQYHMSPAANGGSEGEIESAAGHLDDPPPPSRWFGFLRSSLKSWLMEISTWHLDGPPISHCLPVRLWFGILASPQTLNCLEQPSQHY